MIIHSNLSQAGGLAQKGQDIGSQITVVDLPTPVTTWVLHAYQKDGDDLVEESPLAGIDLAVLQDLFGEPQDNPMYDAYPVRQAQAKRLQSYTGRTLDLQAYDYFVECSGE